MSVAQRGFAVTKWPRCGEVSEWLKELVSKTSVRFPYRGFESRPLRLLFWGFYNYLGMDSLWWGVRRIDT